MSEFILDLSNYKDRVGARVDPGRYRVRVDDAEMDKSKAGNPMVNLWLTIQDGEFDGMTLTDRLVLSERSLFRVVGFMQAIGMPTPKKRLKLSTEKFVGRILDVDVEDGDPYNGRIKSEVRGYIKVTGAAAAAETGDLDLDDLDTAPAAEPEAPSGTAPAETPEPASVAAAGGSDTPEVIDLDTLDL